MFYFMAFPDQILALPNHPHMGTRRQRWVIRNFGDQQLQPIPAFLFRPGYLNPVNQHPHPAIELKTQHRLVGRNQHGTEIGFVTELAFGQGVVKVVKPTAARSVREVRDSVHQQALIEMVMTSQ